MEGTWRQPTVTLHRLIGLAAAIVLTALSTASRGGTIPLSAVVTYVPESGESCDLLRGVCSPTVGGAPFERVFDLESWRSTILDVTNEGTVVVLVDEVIQRPGPFSSFSATRIEVVAAHGGVMDVRIDQSSDATTPHLARFTSTFSAADGRFESSSSDLGLFPQHSVSDRSMGSYTIRLVPEPVTALLLACGLIGMALKRARQG